jgi:hypothetical protein
MSIINLGLQCIGLAREEMSEEQTGSMKEIQKLSQKNPHLREAVVDSVASTKNNFLKYLVVCN